MNNKLPLSYLLVYFEPNIGSNETLLYSKAENCTSSRDGDKNFREADNQFGINDDYDPYKAILRLRIPIDPSTIPKYLTAYVGPLYELSKTTADSNQLTDYLLI